MISERILGHLRDSETGQRGFLLTRNDNYLEPYKTGLTRAKSDFERLRKLTLDNTLQQTRLNKIQKRTFNKFAELEETIQLSKQGKYGEALAIVKSDSGKTIMDAIRRQFSEFISEEERLLELRKDEYNKDQVFLRNAFIIEAVILILLIMIIFFQIQRFLVRPLMLLTKSITRMTTGKDEYIEKNNKRDNDEIDQLTEAFYNMRQMVRERTSQLEKVQDVLEMRVEERTKDLAKANEAMQLEITERKRGEEKLRRYEHIVSSTEDHMLFIGQDYIYQTVNDAYIQAHQKAHHEVIGYSVADLLGVDIFEQLVKEKLDRCLAGEEINYHDWFNFPGLGRRYMDVSYYPFVEYGGEISGIVVSSHDITERKQTEERLKQAATVFENATDGIIITDARGAIATINHAVTKITGYSEEEVLGKNPSIWKSDRHAPSFFQTMWDSLEQRGQWRGEIWSRRKNGEIFPCWQSISAVRDGDAGEIKHYVSIMSDITAIKESQERLHHLAHHDPLTNLPNRLLFNARLEHALERARRKKCGIDVMFLDLDNFKQINDGLGHPVGDKVLQAVAERLNAQVREEDTVARIAGDEFAVILEEISDSKDAAHVAGKILSAFEMPFQMEGQELHVTITIGISLYPEDGKDVTTLVKNADTAMYRAKERGKNRYCFYTIDLTEAALERLQLENDLRLALKQNEFRVYYQPQYALATGRLTGAEALVRWQHPEMGLVSPIKFIPLAENTGLIIPLGEWVLREACAQMKAWQEAGLPIKRISVNVAGQQIQRGGFVKTVRKVLGETGLEPQCLELEITESFIMQQADEAISTLEELRGLGVALAIDDFGTGYSSLSYLKRLPIDKLKIDRSFMKGIPQDPNDEAIARAIIAMSKSLQLKIIAEGVETEEQKEFVRLEGCDEVQGFFYSRPVPAQELEDMLRTQNQ